MARASRLIYDDVIVFMRAHASRTRVSRQKRRQVTVAPSPDLCYL
jgi:hypothetical protein